MCPLKHTESVTLQGHPALHAIIRDEILRSGPVPFARFMDLALYHPDFGYYMRPGEEEQRIGWQGDYYTSPDVHVFLGQALARQARQIDERLGRPDPFTVVEMGAGKGLLARDFIADCAAHAPGFFARLRYRLIERSPAMRAAQARHLEPWLTRQSGAGRIGWTHGLGALSAGSVTGAVLSNELVDAFPVHRIRIAGGQRREIYVAYEADRFVERLGPLSTPALAEYLDRLARMDIVLEEGDVADVNLEALAWMREVGRVMGRGVAITIDYGHTAPDLFGAERRRGTLLCYHDQIASDDPYGRVGLQDMTAHVDFSSLAAAGEDTGLQVTGFTNQMSFLMGWGIEERLSGLEPGSPDYQALIHLLRPEGMGRTFKVLIQHKGMERPELDGLRFKPFFGSALTAHVH